MDLATLTLLGNGLLPDFQLPPGAREDFLKFMRRDLSFAVLLLDMSVGDLDRGDFNVAFSRALGATALAGHYFAKDPEDAMKVIAIAEVIANMAFMKRKAKKAARMHGLFGESGSLLRLLGR